MNSRADDVHRLPRHVDGQEGDAVGVDVGADRGGHASSPQIRSMMMPVPMPGADAQVDQCRALTGALQLVERRAEHHRAGRAQRVPHGNRTAVDVDLAVVEIHGLHVAQHHRRERLVEFPEIDIALGHARLGEHLGRDAFGTRQHDQRLRADRRHRLHLRARLEAIFLTHLLAGDEHGGRSVDDARAVAGMMDVVHALDIGIAQQRQRIEARHILADARESWV